MFTIRKLFHLTHVVRDLDAADQWYDDVFSVNRFYRGYEERAVRHASLVTIGELVMEPVQLANVPGAEKSPIGKFQARFGQRFHSIAWYVDSVVDTFAGFKNHNLRMVDVAGTVVKKPHPAMPIWTHPRETHGLLEFAPNGSYGADPRLQPGWSSAFWRDQHPLGIERTSHITVLTKTLPEVAALYRDVMGGRLIHQEEVAGTRRCAFIAVGEDTVIEVLQPLSAATPEARDLEQYGDGVYAVTFRTMNLSKAAEFLRSKNQRIDTLSADSLMLNKDDAFGMVVGFTERTIPNDPR